MPAETANWISIVMALIAIASVIVTYAVFRSATDPAVIVYGQPDLTRPSLINLIIENIGRGAAYTVSFETSRPLPVHAFGIEVPEEMPDPMTSGPIISGIPFLAPGQRIAIIWGQYGGLYKHIGDLPISVTAQCYRGGPRRWFKKKLLSASILDVQMFVTSESAESGYGPNIVKELKAVNVTLKNMESRLSDLSSDSAAIAALVSTQGGNSGAARLGG